MKYKSIFISDTHLGVKYSRVDLLRKFLKENECDKLYLVGDIIDGWALSRKWHWDADYNIIIQKILRKSRKGTDVVYLSGNHDEFLRKFGEDVLDFGNVKIMESCVHTTVAGKKYLVIHGDEFDGILNSMSFISHIGSWLYDIVLYLNHKYNKIRGRFGLRHYSLAQAIKTRVKDAVKYINKFENTLTEYAKKVKVDGVICGHIHHACHKMIDDVEYWNCGSWLENKCSAIVEHEDGKLELLFIE